MVALRILDFPADEMELAGWLERELIAGDVDDLVSELAVVRNQPPRMAGVEELDSWFGTQRADVLESGLSSLSLVRIRELLKKPELLPLLREVVMIEGGEYWDRYYDFSPPNERRLAEILIQANSRLDGLDGITRPNELKRQDAANDSASESDRTNLDRRDGSGWRRGGTIAGFLAIAAALMLMVGYQIFPQFVRQSEIDGSGQIASNQDAKTTVPGAAALAAGPPWGWTRDELAAMRELSQAEYLRRVAAGGRKWFNVEVSDREGLRKRITELQAGCRLLIAENDQGMKSPQREWLVEKCQSWLVKFDDQLIALDSGGEFTEIRDEMDSVVTKMVDALNRQADDIAAA